MTQWVRQEDMNGCVVASLAMVLGRSYRSVRDELVAEMTWNDTALRETPAVQALPGDKQWEACWRKGGMDFSRSGMCLQDACRWLERKGYATQLRYRYIWGNEVVPEWPPTPWAPIHLVGVTTSQSHAIVMLEDGTLMDPNRPPGTWSGTWAEYKKVEQVVGLWKVQP